MARRHEARATATALSVSTPRDSLSNSNTVTSANSALSPSATTTSNVPSNDSDITNRPLPGSNALHDPSSTTPSAPEKHSQLPVDHSTSTSSSQGSLSKKRGLRSSPFRRWPQAVFCAVSIMTSLMAYSILQERIMTRPYIIPLKHRATTTAIAAAAAARQRIGGETGALVDVHSHSIDASHGAGTNAAKQAAAASPRGKMIRNQTTAFFNNSLFLVLANRLFAAAVAICCILYRKDKDDLRSTAPILEYASISLSNVIATSCQYEALKWLTFPTVTIGKCAKMLPVMIILNLRSGRQYSYDDFGIVGVVLAGCGLMISSGNVTAKRGGSAEADTPFGFILMLVYLLFDAITSTHQEQLFAKYDMSVYNQMLYMNITSAMMSFVGLTLSGGLFNSLWFVGAFPHVFRDVVMLSVSAVAGQFAITYTIQSFGALLYAGIMTTRQFFSVLASDVIFKHGLNRLQWTGAMMVFSALFYKLYRKAVQSAE